LAKKVVYTPWEGKLKDYAKFWPQKRNTYGRGPDTLGKMSSSPMEGKKVGQKLRHF
jgi:hypothetical protein